MTGGQSALSLDSDDTRAAGAGAISAKTLAADRRPRKIIQASDEELQAHQAIIETMGDVAKSWQ